MNTR